MRQGSHRPRGRSGTPNAHPHQQSYNSAGVLLYPMTAKSTCFLLRLAPGSEFFLMVSSRCAFKLQKRPYSNLIRRVEDAWLLHQSLELTAADRWRCTQHDLKVRRTFSSLVDLAIEHTRHKPRSHLRDKGRPGPLAVVAIRVSAPPATLATTALCQEFMLGSCFRRRFQLQNACYTLNGHDDFEASLCPPRCRPVVKGKKVGVCLV